MQSDIAYLFKAYFNVVFIKWTSQMSVNGATSVEKFSIISSKGDDNWKLSHSFDSFIQDIII